MAKHYDVLFLCTGNSARSIFAEVILNRKGRPNFTAYSAGAHPSGSVHPQTLRYLQFAGLPIAGLRSKSWDEFAAPGAPKMDFVFTLCDKAARETCPTWRGHPSTGHWSIPDPTAATGTPEEIQHAFVHAFSMIERRISLFLALPFGKLDEIAIRREARHIGARQPLRVTSNRA
jgi:arsenate reductase